MTRNLYLGADLTPIFTATPKGLSAAVTRVFASVQDTDFPERADALAAEIAATDPDLVGLQEATLWRTETSDDPPTLVPDAQDVAYDFLQILLDKLAALRKHYAAVASIINNDGEAPRDTPTGKQDIRLTDRDVLLARTDLPAHVFSVAHAQSSHFQTALSFPTPALGPVTIPRGWVAVDATVGGRVVRVVDTHLESLQTGVQVAQGDELLTGPLNTSLPTVLLGDLNSAAGGVGAIPHESDTPTASNLVAAGFGDAWTDNHAQTTGFTCCQAADLRNPTATLTERIDYVLHRGTITASVADRVGDRSGDRTRSGLWPSDHAGVWAVLQVH